MTRHGFARLSEKIFEPYAENVREAKQGVDCWGAFLLLNEAYGLAVEASSLCERIERDVLPYPLFFQQPRQFRTQLLS